MPMIRLQKHQEHLIRLPITAAILVMAITSPALAQRASDNAVTSAQDAFGTTVGNESIGLYSTGNVRGFDPVQAGNARLEGLYFDRQADTSSRLTSGSTVRVGISAQSYPFPAPTGIADYHLRLPGDEQVISAVASYGPYDQYGLELDAKFPLVADKLSLGAGVSGLHESWGYGAEAAVWTAGGLLRWRPSDAIEIIPFAGITKRRDFEGMLSVRTAGAILPPKIKRGVYYGQDWADWDTRQTNVGFIGRSNFGDDWVLRAGLYRSLNYREREAANLFLNTQPDGTTDRFAVLSPSNKLDSTSGEVRLSHIIQEGPRQHTLHASVRGRDKTRTFGGSVTFDLGPGVIGIPDDEPMPTGFTFGPMSNSNVKQGTVGLAYEGLWPKVGEMSFALQKTSYKRVSKQPNLADIISKDDPWLFGGTLALYLTDKLAVYGSYTRGLEESSDAPSTAVNRGEPVDASRTSQIDAGVRYAITPRLRFVAGVFQVKKPFFNVNSSNVFTRLGDIRHRGVELSLTGQPLDGLTIVAGTVLLKARVSGEPVTAGRRGEIPLGEPPRVSRLNVQYGPASWAGFSIDGQVVNESSQYADFLNTIKSPSSTVVNLGARYRFSVADIDAMLRFQVQNVTDVFRWNVNSTGSFTPSDRRRFLLSLTADY